MNVKGITEIVQLKDGRKLAYSVYGEKEGEPVFVFHGYTSSRLEGAILDKKAKKFGLKAIYVDRPGIGFSDYQRKRTFLNWAEDINELADIMELDKLKLLGVSAGGSFALACAFRFPERIDIVGMIAPLGAIDFEQQGIMNLHKFAFKCAIFSPLLYRCLYWCVRARFFNQKKLIKAYCYRRADHLSKADRKIFLDSTFSPFIVQSQKEACRQGLKGIAQEAQMLGKKWDFKLDEVDKKIPVHIWHGKEDCVVPYSASVEFDKRLRNSFLNLYPEEGHFSVAINKADKIFPIFLN